jgi:hypothetical protein
VFKSSPEKDSLACQHSETVKHLLWDCSLQRRVESMCRISVQVFSREGYIGGHPCLGIAVI